jgi:hypothetical protein
LISQVSPRAPQDDTRPARPGPASAGRTPGAGLPSSGTGAPGGTAPPHPAGTADPDPTGPGGSESAPTGTGAPSYAAPSAPTATGGPAPSHSTPASTTDPADLQPGELLDQSGTRPDGVAAQLRIFLGGVGDGDCGDDDGSGPPQILVSPQGEIPSPVFACVRGFDPTAPLLVTLTRADGATESTTVPGPGPGIAFVVSLMLRPGWPTGTYRLTVQQGHREVNAVLAVGLVTLPTLWFAAPDVVAGDDNALYLGGYPPGRPVTLYLYGSSHRRDTQPYRTSFTTRMDERGEGQVLFHTGPGQAGCYGVTSMPMMDPERPNPMAQFCIT